MVLINVGIKGLSNLLNRLLQGVLLANVDVFAEIRVEEEEEDDDDDDDEDDSHGKGVRERKEAS
jgi:hypothetical protein